MNSRPHLSIETLSQIIMMQSVVTRLPDKKTILEFTCGGLKDIDGVEDVVFLTDETNTHTHTQQDSGHADESCRVKTFTIKQNGQKHADILFYLSDEQSFAPYIPYVSNFCTVLGITFDERFQRERAELLMRDLEDRVHERTRELEAEITRRKSALEALAAEKERLAVTLESIGDGVITTDINGRVRIINKVAEGMTGWTQKDAWGLPLGEVFNIIHEITGARCENPVEKVLRTGAIIELANHTKLISRDNREIIIADSGAPIKDTEGKTIGVVLVFRDITEKQRLLEMAQRTSRLDSLGILAGGIAHDFNNLLGGVYGYIDLAREKTNQAVVSDYLSKASASIGRARALTQQLLTFAKGGAPTKGICAIAPLLRESVDFALSGSQIVCTFNIEDHLWPCSIDKHQIGQVMDNLVINAIQAMPGGGTIELEAVNTKLGEHSITPLTEGPYVKISLKDTGGGIAREHLPHIFDPFFSTKNHGHGLGLSTCYSIVNRHGGAIDVNSHLGAGTTFTLFLPACPDAALKEDVKTSPTRHTELERGTILVMEDEPLLCEMTKAMLESLNYQAICTSNGTDAIELFKREYANKRIVAMIFDLTIPGDMGGKEAIVEVRRLDPDLPVFVASGYANDPVMASPQQYGFTASLSKPFKKNELQNLLQCHLTLRP